MVVPELAPEDAREKAGQRERYVGGGDTTTGGGGESRSPLYCTSPPSSVRIVSEAEEREIQ